MFGVFQQTYNLFTGGSKRFNLYHKTVEEVEGKLHVKGMSEKGGLRDRSRLKRLGVFWHKLLNC